MNDQSGRLIERVEPLLASVFPAHATLTELRGDVLVHVQGRRDRLHAVASLDAVDELCAFPPTNWRWVLVESAELESRKAQIDAAATRARAGVLVADGAGLARARTAPPHPGIFDRRHDGLTAAWSQLSDW
jgi:hypothetical protein